MNFIYDFCSTICAPCKPICVYANSPENYLTPSQQQAATDRIIAASSASQKSPPPTKFNPTIVHPPIPEILPIPSPLLEIGIDAEEFELLNEVATTSQIFEESGIKDQVPLIFDIAFYTANHLKKKDLRPFFALVMEFIFRGEMQNWILNIPPDRQEYFLNTAYGQSNREFFENFPKKIESVFPQVDKETKLLRSILGKINRNDFRKILLKNIETTLNRPACIDKHRSFNIRGFLGMSTKTMSDMRDAILKREHPFLAIVCRIILNIPDNLFMTNAHLPEELKAVYTQWMEKVEQFSRKNLNKEEASHLATLSTNIQTKFVRFSKHALDHVLTLQNEVPPLAVATLLGIETSLCRTVEKILNLKQAMLLGRTLARLIPIGFFASYLQNYDMPIDQRRMHLMIVKYLSNSSQEILHEITCYTTKSNLNKNVFSTYVKNFLGPLKTDLGAYSLTLSVHDFFAVGSFLEKDLYDRVPDRNNLETGILQLRADIQRTSSECSKEEQAKIDNDFEQLFIIMMPFYFLAIAKEQRGRSFAENEFPKICVKKAVKFHTALMSFDWPEPEVAIPKTPHPIPPQSPSLQNKPSPSPSVTIPDPLTRAPLDPSQKLHGNAPHEPRLTASLKEQSSKQSPKEEDLSLADFPVRSHKFIQAICEKFGFTLVPGRKHDHLVDDEKKLVTVVSRSSSDSIPTGTRISIIKTAQQRLVEQKAFKKANNNN